MHLVYYTLGVCIVNGWLLYRRHCHQNGTCIQYTMHLEYALLIGWLLYRRHCHQNGTCIQYTMHLEYALLMDGCCIEDTATKMVHSFSILCTGVCIVNGWLLYRRHCHQNGTCIQYTMHLEYALLIDGCCIEDTAIKMVHAFSILCTWSMHC